MHNTSDIHRGGCLCGNVRYVVAAPPLRSAICHCRTCRKAASSPTLPFVTFPAAAFSFELGTPQQFASSADVVRAFCGDCGSPLTYANRADLETIDVMTVSLDNPEDYPPEDHVWVSHKLEWDVIGDQLPSYPKGRTD
jgi:hypothetical protein